MRPGTFNVKLGPHVTMLHNKGLDFEDRGPHFIFKLKDPPPQQMDLGIDERFEGLTEYQKYREAGSHAPHRYDIIL